MNNKDTKTSNDVEVTTVERYSGDILNNTYFENLIDSMVVDNEKKDI